MKMVMRARAMATVMVATVMATHTGKAMAKVMITEVASSHLAT